MVVASHASCPPTAFQSDAHNNIEASVLGIRTFMCAVIAEARCSTATPGHLFC